MAGKERNPRDKVSKLIGAVGETLKEKGYPGLGVNKVAATAGVSKPMIYAYFGSFNGLLKAYIGANDTWMRYFGTLALPENPTAGELKACFIRILQDQLRYCYEEKEMQRLVHWQISEGTPLMRAACEAREKEGNRLLAMVEGHFRNSGVNLNAVMALLVGGIYFNVLHDSAGTGTIAGMNLKDEKHFEEVSKSIAQIVGWAFAAAENRPS